MIDFGNPWMLMGLIPWTIGCVWFYAGQRRCLRWIDENVAFRFRRQLTAYSSRTLTVHMVFITAAGALLVLAMSEPSVPTSSGLAEGGGRVLFVLDGSASMRANDVLVLETQAPESRFEQARRIAHELVESLPDYEFGLVSFSGDATIQLPLTSDRLLVEDALHFAETHNIYQNTGSSLTRALDSILLFVDDDSPGLQVVLLGDGEMPEPEDYEDALDAVAAREIPIHAVAIGSEEGQTRLIYDFRDIVAKKEEKTVLLEFTTKRVDEHFREIADATGGTFGTPRMETVPRLAAAIQSTPVRVSTAEERPLELEGLLYLLFVAIFVVDALVYGYAKPDAPSFRIYALGDQGRDVRFSANAVGATSKR